MVQLALCLTHAFNLYSVLFNVLTLCFAFDLFLFDQNVRIKLFNPCLNKSRYQLFQLSLKRI